jgi:N-acetyl sugar amidotransferase
MQNRNTKDWGSLAPTGLPLEVSFCRRCVISNQKPITKIESHHSKNDYKETVSFSDGICDACRWAEEKENRIDWLKRENELLKLCDKHRRTDGRYDVIVPASGGKDSRYVAHILKAHYGMNPLTVTWMPHRFTEVGLQNFFGLIDGGQANILYSPRGDVHKKLTSLAFKNLGHPFQPFIVGQRVVGPKTALSYDVNLVFYGENVAEYGNRYEENFSPLMDPRLYACFDFTQSSLDSYMIAGLSLKDLIKKYGFTLSDFYAYKSPSLNEIQKNGVEVHYMSYYRKWVPQDNYYYAVEHTGFTPNEKRKDGSYSKYAGIDDLMEDLHFYMQMIKFGMGRCTWDAAQEVRTGKLEREEAISLVRKYDQERPTEFFDQIISYLGVSRFEFETIVDSFRPKHLWQRDGNGDFVLKKPVS